MSDDPLAPARGIRNALIIAITLFWIPFIASVIWLANR